MRSLGFERFAWLRDGSEREELLPEKRRRATFLTAAKLSVNVGNRITGGMTRRCLNAEKVVKADVEKEPAGDKQVGDAKRGVCCDLIERYDGGKVQIGGIADQTNG